MWFSLKLGFRAFLGISRKNWDFTQNIWISGARGHLKSPQKCPEIHKNARNPDFCEIPIFGKPHGKGPGKEMTVLRGRRDPSEGSWVGQVRSKIGKNIKILTGGSSRF